MKSMKRLKQSWGRVPKLARQVSVVIVGTIVILAGIIMLAIPGPGWLTIFLGLAILATEFIWAKHLRDWIANKFKSAYQKMKNSRKSKK